MADIFFSYKSDERDRVAPIVAALEAEGWTVFWDRKTPVGISWSQYIQENLAQAQCVVVVWSRQSIESHWVETEAGEGRDRRCLVPLKLDDVTPPFGFGHIQAADFTRWAGDTDTDEWCDLVAAIDRHVPRRAESPTDEAQYADEVGDQAKVEPARFQRNQAADEIVDQLKAEPAGNSRLWKIGAAFAVTAILLALVLTEPWRDPGTGSITPPQPTVPASGAAMNEKPVGSAGEKDDKDSEPGAPEQGAWFTVLASIPGNDLTRAKIIANEKYGLVHESERSLSVELWKTKISNNYAVVVGGVQSESEAAKLAEGARANGWASDAFAQIDKEWHQIGVAPFQLNLPGADIVVLSSINLRERCPQWDENTDVVQKIGKVMTLNKGDSAKLVKKVKTLFGHPWWEIEVFDEKRGAVVSGCATAESDGVATMEHLRK